MARRTNIDWLSFFIGLDVGLLLSIIVSFFCGCVADRCLDAVRECREQLEIVNNAITKDHVG